MPPADKKDYPDELLERYLLGALSAAESEQLDELSIADNELAWRLDALEHDLVDAFVRNELSGGTLEQFERHYLSSPARREKVEIARTLLEWKEKRLSEREVVAGKRVAAGPKVRAKSVTGARFDWLHWGLAATAVVLCVFAAYLFEESSRLSKLRNDAEKQEAILDQRVQQLERELTEERGAKEGEQSSGEVGEEETALKTIAVLLLPPTRGLGKITSIVIPAGTERVALRMSLESDDFTAYSATLKDPASGTTLWSAANLKAISDGQKRVVAVNVPASALKQQNYDLELSGIPERGAAEIVSSYRFKVVPR